MGPEYEFENRDDDHRHGHGHRARAVAMPLFIVLLAVNSTEPDARAPLAGMMVGATITGLVATVTTILPVMRPAD